MKIVIFFGGRRWFLLSWCEIGKKVGEFDIMYMYRIKGWWFCDLKEKIDVIWLSEFVYLIDCDWWFL